MVKHYLSEPQDYDTLSDLFEKLDELPGDLQGLYDHTLAELGAQDRLQGSKLVQLAQRCLETHGANPRIVLRSLSAEEDESSISRSLPLANQAEIFLGTRPTLPCR